MKVDRKAFPYVYVGPTTRWGIKNGTPVHRLIDDQGRPMKGRSGLLGFTSPDGKAWQLPPSQIVPYEPPRRAPKLRRVREALGRHR